MAFGIDLLSAAQQAGSSPLVQQLEQKVVTSAPGVAPLVTAAQGAISQQTQTPLATPAAAEPGTIAGIPTSWIIGGVILWFLLKR